MSDKEPEAGMALCPNPHAHEYPWGAHVTEAAAHPLHTPGMLNEANLTAGMLLFSHAREARWQGIRTKEYPKQWNYLSEEIKKEWEKAALEIANAVRAAP